MAATIATTGRTATRPWNIVGTDTTGSTAGNERRNGQVSAPTRLLTAALYGLQNLQRLDSDLSVSERHRDLVFSNGSRQPGRSDSVRSCSPQFWQFGQITLFGQTVLARLLLPTLFSSFLSYQFAFITIADACFVLHANGTTNTPSSANAANIAHASLTLQTKAAFSIIGRT
jgi:hypothetical protein